ncbi:MAG: aspartate/tyrosine/aromatic aminotransferase [Parvularculaceae bacterium]|nr:aspartate/tyrosine/aromatic aminotransferase [Parvularculaceae bacterium]
MFADLDKLPADPLLGLTRLYQDDARATKIDLGVGVFKTPDNKTPVMKAVVEAQKNAALNETTKAYTPADGAPGFGDAIAKLLLGDINPRAGVIQAPGGCGALRLGAELIKRGGARGVTIGAPTWGNHQPLISAAGVAINMVPYYDAAAGKILFDEFYTAVEKLEPKDALLLHGCCHNPTGADMSREQVDAIIDLAAKRGCLVFIDTAYHGFANGLEDDAYLVRRAVERLPELLISYSCSKNFGLYRERTGALIVVGETPERAEAMRSHVHVIARQSWSMPPAHGGVIVAGILSNPALTKAWKDELEAMRLAVIGNRQLLVETAREHQLGDRLDYIAGQHGMFSMLPLNPDQVMAMRERHGVYMAGNGRINMCGVNKGNVGHLVAGVADVLAG